MARKKIAPIGADQIGGNLALLAGLKEQGGFVSVGVIDGVSRGNPVGIAAAVPIEACDLGYASKNTYAALQGADMVTAMPGMPRKPGMRWDELIATRIEVAAEGCTVHLAVPGSSVC